MPPATWLQSQFDKLLMASLVIALCGFSILANDKLSTFALQSAAGCLGCLITLVTARRPAPPDPTSSVTTTTSTTKAETVTPPVK